LKAENGKLNGARWKRCDMAEAGGAGERGAAQSKAGTRRIRVNVTARDIAQGSQRDFVACPVALAMRRHRVFAAVEVGIDCFWFAERGLTIPLPPIASGFIKRFDTLRRARPFSFSLKLAEGAK
jgi:hypothetical protein